MYSRDTRRPLGRRDDRPPFLLGDVRAQEPDRADLERDLRRPCWRRSLGEPLLDRVTALVRSPSASTTSASSVNGPPGPWCRPCCSRETNASSTARMAFSSRLGPMDRLGRIWFVRRSRPARCGGREMPASGRAEPGRIRPEGPRQIKKSSDRTERLEHHGSFDPPRSSWRSRERWRPRAGFPEHRNLVGRNECRRSLRTFLDNDSTSGLVSRRNVSWPRAGHTLAFGRSRTNRRLGPPAIGLLGIPVGRERRRPGPGQGLDVGIAVLAASWPGSEGPRASRSSGTSGRTCDGGTTGSRAWAIITAKAVSPVNGGRPVRAIVHHRTRGHRCRRGRRASGRPSPARAPCTAACR